MNDLDDVKSRLIDDREKSEIQADVISGSRVNGDSPGTSSQTDNTFRDNLVTRNDVSSTTSEDQDQRIYDDAPIYVGGCDVFCDPRSKGHKGIFLILMCSIGFGSYFCYDNPGALQVRHVVAVTY